MDDDRKSWSTKFAALVSVCLILLSFASCIETKPLLQGRRDGRASIVTNIVYHGCGYKDDLWMSHWNAGGDRQRHLLSVRPKYNYWYALATVLSFGLYMPIELEWNYDFSSERDSKNKEGEHK